MNGTAMDATLLLHIAETRHKSVLKWFLQQGKLQIYGRAHNFYALQLKPEQISLDTNKQWLHKFHTK